MFVSIRKYHNVKSVQQVSRRAELEFVPLLKQNPGFQSYYLIDCESPLEWEHRYISQSIRQLGLCAGIKR